MAVKHKVIECQESPDCINIIVRVLETIKQQNSFGTDREKMCEKIVTYLGAIATPTSPTEYCNFMAQVDKIREILVTALADETIILATLQALYNEISNPQKTPNPTMSIVLQLIDLKHIPHAVRCILDNGYQESCLEQALNTLCSWLCKWTYTPNLGPLVLQFMQGLAGEHHYDILIEVTLAYIDKLFKLLILPDTRETVGHVVFYMLLSMQNNAKAFHKILPLVKPVVESLWREGSPSSRQFLEYICNLCMVLMERFPGRYDQIEQTFQLINYSASEMTSRYKQLIVEYNTWVDTSNLAVPIQLTPGKVGLNNLGNTCYMNSVLQALFMTKCFRNDILQCSRDVTPLVSKLQILFALLQFSERSSLSPSDVSNVARPPSFQVGHQHDSSEFLGYLLDVLHEQERSIYSQQDVSSTSAGFSTLVKDSFGGRTLTLSQCNNCGSKSERADAFRDLQLSFPNNSDNQSVHTLIDYYLQPEKLCDDNQYHCDSCGGLSDGERITKIIEQPKRLVLTLKHFRYDPATQSRTKILQRVQLDNEIELEFARYKLYAAVVHCGSSVDSGHYYTYANDGSDWYKFNDCFVMKSKAEELYSLQPPEAPYILFYSRLDCADPEMLDKSDLSSKLQTVLDRDIDELNSERNSSQVTANRNRQNRRDEPPSPGCGDVLIEASHNRYVS